VFPVDGQTDRKLDGRNYVKVSLTTSRTLLNYEVFKDFYDL
jgi:hypothetical protein